MSRIVRSLNAKNYTVMPNYHLRDQELSLKAKGLMSYMVSLPPDWELTVEGLVKCVKEGPSAVKSALTELEKHGYLVRTRKKTADGKFSGIDYVLYEKPAAENRLVENRSAENQGQINTILPITDLKITKLNTTRRDATENRRTRFIPPTVEEVQAYVSEKGYSVDAKRFVDWYTNTGWKTNRGRPIKDWKTSVRMWASSEKKPIKPKAPEKPKYHIKDFDEYTEEELAEFARRREAEHTGHSEGRPF